jgi:hypothetical protein
MLKGYMLKGYEPYDDAPGQKSFVHRCFYVANASNLPDTAYIIPV